MLLSRLAGGRRAAWMLLLMLGACAPVLDWREVKPEDSAASLMFPCKPTTDARMVSLAGGRVRMQIAACRAGDVTWALAYADVADPVKVTPALAALRESAVGNLKGSATAVGALQIAGMTPNPQAERLRVRGGLPSGEAVTLEAGFFVRGTRVYQATVMGKALDAEALAMFFDGVKLLP
jgi:hypothetical protein